MKKISAFFIMVCLGGLLMNGTAAAEAQRPEFQTTGLTQQNLPVFYEKLKSKLTYPLSWNSGKYANFSKWQKEARNKVLSYLPNEESVAFQPEVIDEQDRGSYIAKKVVFNLTPESRVAALMLVPKGEGPFPAALLLHDHGAKFEIGKEKLIQPWGDENKEAAAKLWSEKYFSGHFVGDELAKRGYVVLAVDSLGWSDRGIIKYENQQALESNLLNLGVSLAGLMAYEDMRSADFLASLPEVNKNKVAAVGFSMGAYRAWQVAALADSIKAGVAVCWMGTTDGLMVPGNNQLKGQSAYYMLHPGLVNYMDYPDVASLAAPKPMLFYNGSDDKLFPQESVQSAYQSLHKVWQSQHADNKLETKIWPGKTHEFVQEEQEAVYEWLDKQFK